MPLVRDALASWHDSLPGGKPGKHAQLISAEALHGVSCRTDVKLRDFLSNVHQANHHGGTSFQAKDAPKPKHTPDESVDPKVELENEEDKVEETINGVALAPVAVPCIFMVGPSDLCDHAYHRFIAFLWREGV